MAFRAIKSFRLELDGPEDAVYRSGEVLSGQVVLELHRPTRVRGMRVVGRGVATAHWLENRSTVGINSVYNDYTSKITYFRKRQHLIRDNGELTTLPAGRHEFPFSFQLPEETLVTSFEGKHGSIRYWVKVKLHRPWATVRKIKKEFTVIEPIDINTPTLLAPQAGTKDKMARVWYRNFGQVSISAKIDRKGYTPGEVIPVFAEFDNATSRSVVPKAYITQTQTFIARGTMKQKRSVVATLSGDVVGARRRETWHGRAIKIPPVGPSILQCRIIKVEYMLRVCVDVPGTSKLCLELPLVMGTIPLHPFGSRTSSVGSQYSCNLEWLRLAIPEQPEPPPDYSSVVTAEEAEQRTSSPRPTPTEDLSGILQRPLMAFVQEFRFLPPPVYSDDSADAELGLPCTPCIRIRGDHLFEIAVDQEVVNDHITSPIVALSYAFSLFYVCNIEYPKEMSLTLEFMQRVFFGINPDRGSKAEMKGKKRHHIPPKLSKLVTELKETGTCWDSAFQWGMLSGRCRTEFLHPPGRGSSFLTDRLGQRLSAGNVEWEV